MTSPKEKTLDCIVAGSCVVDLLCRPVSLDQPIGASVLHEVGPLQVTCGGIVANSGITMSRLGMKVGAFSYLGDDAWAPVVRDLYKAEGLDTAGLMTHPTEATSTTVVMIDGGSGERSFYHCVGAPKTMNAQTYLSELDLLGQAKMVLIGYYSLMPNLQDDLPDVLAELRKRGCQTALDAAGAGGDMQPLDRILPHLDVYVPSQAEALHQTKFAADVDPRKIIDAFRDCGAPGLVGVKLGTKGAMLSPRAGEYLSIPAVAAPGAVIDTTGAGDSFYAGLLAGLLKGLPVEEAGRMAVAAGACCVTAMGGCTGGRSWDETAKLAGLV